MSNTEAGFEPVWAAGFMSGTSLDAVDGALILTDGVGVVDFGPAVEVPYTPAQRAVLREATDAARAWSWRGQAPEEEFDAARQVIVETHLAAYRALTSGAPAPRPVIAGVHGQTVLHRPPRSGMAGATLQLVDAPALHAAFGIELAYDFRSADVAAGGQGAPLAPAYHAALLDRLGPGASAVLNLGGVANITARMAGGEVMAFDTGPANGPIDEWVEGHGRGTYDEGGRIARQGAVHEGLIAQLFEHPFFVERPPKSLDRYDFNANMARGLSLEDGAATLTAFSARAVAVGTALLPERPERVVVCGGGRHNPALMDALRSAVDVPVSAAEDVGWRGDSVEAEAFAFLAVRCLRGLPIGWPATTGVPRPMTGGRRLGG
ncbi:MAG: anhydro-N-acetylmuramic acid kinase [Pseudomonadota bacterium]